MREQLSCPLGSRSDIVRFQWGSLILLAPAIVLLIGLFIVPVVYSFYLGFTNLMLTGPTSTSYQFTGLANVSRLIHDPTFYLSLRVTAYFVFGSVLGVVVVAMILAVALQTASRSVRLCVGSIAIITWMMPALSAGLAWYAATAAGGVLSGILGLPNEDFLAASPVLVITLANIWSITGLVMLIFSAALRNVPKEALEAAAIESAGPLRIFTRISLPVVWPTVVTSVLIVMLLSVGNFSLVYIMTQGGPGNATNILTVYSYQQAFSFQYLGYGALIGDALVVVASIVAVLYVRVSRVRI